MKYVEYIKLEPFDIAERIVKAILNNPPPKVNPSNFIKKIWYDYASSLRGPGLKDLDGPYILGVKALLQGFLRGKGETDNSIVNHINFEVMIRYLDNQTNPENLVEFRSQLKQCQSHYLNHILAGLDATSFLGEEVKFISTHIKDIILYECYNNNKYKDYDPIPDLIHSINNLISIPTKRR